MAPAMTAMVRRLMPPPFVGMGDAGHVGGTGFAEAGADALWFLRRSGTGS